MVRKKEFTMTDTSIPAETRIGHVHLKVADLDRAIGFYRDYLRAQTPARSWLVDRRGV
jgi:catechol-2,3-dioxygenase